jgi:L-threonylcarbamoyladenylate synthase
VPRILPADAAPIAHAAEIIRRGGLVAFPTETVYGLGADALNPLAVARIFEVKSRPAFDPIIVHVASASAAWDLWSEVPTDAYRLMAKFWPGPLTIVLPKRPTVPDIVTAGLDTVGVRIPDHRAALALIRESGRPIAAPSANRFGRTSPTTAAAVAEELGDSIDLILDGGPTRVGVESTVVARLEGRWTVLRPGGTTLEQLREALGAQVRSAGPATAGGAPADRDGAPQPSPGLLKRHYAPSTPLTLVPTPSDAAALARTGGRRLGLLCLTRPAGPEPFAAVEELSASGDLREAAAGLFAALRRLDAAGLDGIVAATVPESGLGVAINDRLRRAAAKPA